MKLLRRCQRILILSLLSLSVLAPLVLVSQRLKTITSFGPFHYSIGVSMYFFVLGSGFD